MIIWDKGVENLNYINVGVVGKKSAMVESMMYRLRSNFVKAYYNYLKKDPLARRYDFGVNFIIVNETDELQYVDYCILIKDQDDIETELNPNDAGTDKIIKALNVFMNRYLICRDFGLEHKASKQLDNIRDAMTCTGARLVQAYQSYQDADGNITYVPIEEAYRTTQSTKDKAMGW